MSIQLTAEERQELIDCVRTWLKPKGIEYLRDLKELHGSLNAQWCELGELDNITQFVPRSIASQEGKFLRLYLRTLSICKEWDSQDYMDNWLWIMDESIEEE